MANLVDPSSSLGHGGFEGPYIIGADLGGGHGGQSVPSWEPALADLGYRQGMSFRVGDLDGDAGSAWALLDVRSGADRWREAYDAQPDFEHSSDAPGAGFSWVRDYTGDGTPDVLSIAFDGVWTTPVLRLLEGRGGGTFRHPITVLGPGETTQWLSQGG